MLNKITTNSNVQCRGACNFPCTSNKHVPESEKISREIYFILLQFPPVCAILIDLESNYKMS